MPDRLDPARPPVAGPSRGDLGERARLAGAMRILIDRLVGADADEEALQRATAAVEQAVAALEGFPPIGDKPIGLPRFEDLQSVFWRDPTIGLANPIAPPLRIEVEDTVVRGTTRFHHGYEGPPGYVHGAVIAGCFDQMLGLANLAGGHAGMTGTLTIRYRKPTPLETDVVFEAHTQGTEGRKIFTNGTLLAGDVLCAEAEGIFINLTIERGTEYFLRKKD